MDGSDGAGHGHVEHLQRSLTHLLHEKYEALLKEMLHPKGLARLQSCKAKLASTWLRTAPPGIYEISDSTCEHAIRLRLGMRLSKRINSRHCVCGRILRMGTHLMTCSSIRGGLSIRRHDHVVRIVAKYIRMVGGTAKVEPRRL